MNSCFAKVISLVLYFSDPEINFPSRKEVRQFWENLGANKKRIRVGKAHLCVPPIVKPFPDQQLLQKNDDQTNLTIPLQKTSDKQPDWVIPQAKNRNNQPAEKLVQPKVRKVSGDKKVDDQAKIHDLPGWAFLQPDIQQNSNFAQVPKNPTLEEYSHQANKTKETDEMLSSDQESDESVTELISKEEKEQPNKTLQSDEDDNYHKGTLLPDKEIHSQLHQVLHSDEDDDQLVKNLHQFNRYDNEVTEDRDDPGKKQQTPDFSDQPGGYLLLSDDESQWEVIQPTNYNTNNKPTFHPEENSNQIPVTSKAIPSPVRRSKYQINVSEEYVEALKFVWNEPSYCEALKENTSKLCILSGTCEDLNAEPNNKEV